jgi:hypothetical protein
MDDIYYDKYIKYKRKYLNKKNQMGGDIQEFKNLFNSYFLDNWILTGSEAIKLYLIHFKRLDLLTFTPNDIDILYIEKELTNRSIGNFTRVQSTIEKSMTFKYEDKSFDITIQPSSNYYIIDGIKVIPPDDLYIIYNDNRLSSDSEEKKEVTKKKLDALTEIKKLMLGMPKLRLSVIKRRLSTEIDFSEKKGKKRKSLFSNSDNE